MESTGTTSVVTLVLTLATVALAFFMYNRNVINATTAALRSQLKPTLNANARAQIVKDLLQQEAETEKKKKKASSASSSSTGSHPNSSAATVDPSQKKV